MSKIITVELPDIGDFEKVEIIEVLVSSGDKVQSEDSLLTLESDKATIEIPSPQAGIVDQVLVAVGEKVSQGDSILTLKVEHTENAVAAATEPAAKASEGIPEPSIESTEGDGEADLKTQILILGSGPGGYTAAFRAADLGKSVILIERHNVIGGVCLNVGCIPSKALLHVAQVINEASHFNDYGVGFGKPKIKLSKLGHWKDSVVGRLRGG